MKEFETLEITVEESVALVEMNRPEKSNALSRVMWQELKEAFEWIDGTPGVRVAVLAGRGKNFSAGIDFEFLMTVHGQVNRLPEGGKQERLRQIIEGLQESVSAIERCRKPVLAAIHGACIGGGIDLVTACDMRYAEACARFSVREVDLAIVPDTGTLQRLPALTGEGVARELVFTGREFGGEEACALGLVNRVFQGGAALRSGVMEIASAIAAKSPLTVRGIKESMNHSRDHTVAEGLKFTAARSASLLLSKDVAEAVAAQLEKRQPVFED